MQMQNDRMQTLDAAACSWRRHAAAAAAGNAGLHFEICILNFT
jgi:hypothetical protein